MVNNNMSEYYLKIIIIGDLGVGKLLWGAVIAGISDFLANFWRQNFWISTAAVVYGHSVFAMICFERKNCLTKLHTSRKFLHCR